MTPPSLDSSANGAKGFGMKWKRAKGRKDRNVIDARGSSPPSGGSGLGGLSIPGGITGIGHEMGHHVQSLRGTEAEVAELTRDDPDRANELSVRTELQADCYALHPWHLRAAPRVVRHRL
jgi:putative neutral zinc metallopeptidase